MSSTCNMVFASIPGNPKNGGSGHTVYIEVLSYTGTPLWKEFCDKVFKKWRKYNPTIHLAKEWQLLDGGEQYMKQVLLLEIYWQNPDYWEIGD